MFEPESSRPISVFAGLLASLALGACSSVPPASHDLLQSAAPDAPVVEMRCAADVQRIGELDRQIFDQQRQLAQLAEKQRQLIDRQRQSIDEKQRLENQLKESQLRANELQAKLDAILAIDRDMRRGRSLPNESSLQRRRRPRPIKELEASR